VDSEAFAEAATHLAVPPDLEALPRPRVGYVGAVNDKVDFGLLREAARRRPHWSVVLVGPWAVREDADAFALRDTALVHFLGKRDVSQVPSYVASLDVCLMPYKLNEWTQHINPLKMYEYLAAGRPVVSTRIPAVEPFAEWIDVAEGADAFVEAVEKALARDDAEQRQRRIEVASQHTWDARVELISEKLAEFLQAQSRAADERVHELVVRKR
jgi:glycosyltransferase involved in cell wall biosynthesis